MNNEKGSPQYDHDPQLKRVWNQGYWHGYDCRDPKNVYKRGTPEWEAYEDGYEEGWLDS